MNKTDVLNKIAGYDRGLLANSQDQAMILAAITRLEEQNPTPDPVSSPDLEGDWRLLYTNSTGILGINKIPFCKLGSVYQCIRASERRVYNIAEVESLPLLEGIISVAALFTPVSAQRVTVQFDRVVIGSQKVLGYRSPAAYIEQLCASNRLLAIDNRLPPRDNPGWLDITYLDADLRIGRGNQGSVFVLSKV